MGSNAPLQSAHPLGGKLNDIILISERNGSAMRAPQVLSDVASMPDHTGESTGICKRLGTAAKNISSAPRNGATRPSRRCNIATLWSPAAKFHDSDRR